MDAEQVKDKLESMHFHISRVPRPTYLIFKELADSEFCGDYGLCLKWLLEKALDDTDDKIENLQKQINELKEEKEKSKKPLTFGKEVE